MNKKLLLGAALLIGMGPVFTSCVDSTESASVTAVREAKAEQLKAIAEYNKAQAEAAIILANAQQAAQAANQAYQEAQAAKMEAEADYLRAQAAYVNAQALVEEAKAAAMNAQTEADQKRLEMELKEREAALKEVEAQVALLNQQLAQAEENLKEQQKRFEYELLNLEQTVAQTKIQTDILQQQYEDAVTTAKNAATDRERQIAAENAKNLYSLLTQYQNAADALTAGQKILANYNLRLMRLEANLVTAKQTAQDNITDLENQNLELNAKIQAKNAVIAAYAEYAGKEVTQEMELDAMDKYSTAKADFNDADQAWKDTQAPLAEAESKMQSSDYVVNLRSLFGNYDGWADVNKEGDYEQVRFVIRKIQDYELDAPANCLGKYALVVTERVYKPHDIVYSWDGAINVGEGNGDFVYSALQRGYEYVGPGNGDTLLDYNPSYSYSYEEDKVTPSKVTYVPVCEAVDRKEAEVSFKPTDVNNGIYTYYVYSAYYNLIDDGAGLQEWLDYKTQAIEHNEIDTEQVAKDLAAAQTALVKAQEAYDTARANYESAQTEYNKYFGNEATVDISQLQGTEADLQGKFDTAESAYNTAKAALGENPTAEQLATLTPLETAMNSAKEALDNAKKATAAAILAQQIAYANLLGGSYTQDGKVVEVKVGALDAKDDAYIALLQAKSTVNELTNLLNNNNNQADQQAQRVEEVTEKVNAIIADAATNEENIEATNAAIENAENAYVAKEEASANVLAAKEYYESIIGLQWVKGESDTYAQQVIAAARQDIQGWQGEIEENDRQIKQYKAELAQLESNDPQLNNKYYNDMIERLNNKIAEQTAYNEVLQTKFDIIKAQLDAFLKSDTETPAE